jgi:DNA polymerase-3 subunit delta
MKLSSMRAFLKHLEGGETAGFCPLYLILSPGGGENRVALERLVKRISERERIPPLGITTFETPSVGRLDEELATLSFFSPKRVIIVRGAGELSLEVQERVLKGEKGCYLILSGLSGTSSFYKKVEKVGMVVELGAQKSWEKEKSGEEWVLQRALEERKSIEPAAAKLLAKDCKGDISLIDQEFEKLINYTYGRQKITREDVVAISIHEPAVTVFQLLEALFKKDVLSAVGQFRALFDEGISYFAILKQLRGQILIDLEIASIVKTGGHPSEITASYPYIKGFILEKRLAAALSYGFEGLKRALLLIDDFELRAKQGSVDDELLADLFTVRMAA